MVVPAMAASAPPADAALLVALGAVPGAWLRFRLVNQLEPLLPRRHWGTLVVNGSACFAIGLLTAVQGSVGPGAPRLLLLLGTGFLGSFSTFSGFLAEWQTCLSRGQRRQALLLVLSSLLLGLLACAAGLKLGAGS
jgi:CrcB protein